jgi:hypothetical protein
MPSPLDQVTYDDSPAYLKISTFAGNALSVLLTIPFDTTNYEFSGDVVNDTDESVCMFTTEKTSSGTPTVYKVNYSLTPEQTASIPTTAYFRFKWIEGGVSPRTFISGPFEARKTW